MKKKYIIIGVIGSLILLMGGQLYLNKKHIDAGKQRSTRMDSIPIPVITEVITYQELTTTFTKTGTLAPDTKAVLYAPYSGNIAQVYFELGSRISKGTTLLEMDASALQIDLENAQIKAAKLYQDLKTYQELLEGEATTQEIVNQYQLDYSDAQHQVKRLEKQLVDTRVKAPLTGVIVDKKAALGVYVNAGTELGTLIDIRHFKVQVYLSEYEVYQLKEQDQVQLHTDIYPGHYFTGTVTYISEQGDATHNYLVEVSLPNSKTFPLKSGTFIYVTFATPTINSVLTIPRTALLENSQTPQVYVVHHKKAKLQEVQLGNDYGDRVAILAGLKEGSRIVISGQINLKDQSAVTLAQKTKNK